MRYPSRIAAACTLIAFAVGLSLAATDPVVDENTPEEAVRALIKIGKQYYVTNCASCHGVTAAGGGPVARSLKVTPPDLRYISARRGGEFDVDQLSQFIDGRLLPGAHGSREMPIWGSAFSDESGGGKIGDEISRGRIVALLEYLRTLQRK
jgi:mono/diheme cytochrome c family protein